MGIKIIFVDSDGTVMDSMTPKHMTSFGPAMIDIFNLKDNEKEILEKWNMINLYSLSRGINRFDGLYQCLLYVDSNFKKIDLLDQYKYWLDTTNKKSNQSLLDYIEKTGHKELLSVVKWSEETNRRIALSVELVKPFEYAIEGISLLHNNFKIMIISSANGKAVRDEWTKFGLFNFCDEILTQEMGTKEVCIAKMIEKYQPEEAIMIGDSPLDYEAAKHNKILFYPIIPKMGNDSWKEICDKYAEMFLNKEYKKVENKVIEKFINSLK